MAIQFQKDGYVSKILTWGMPLWKKQSYLANLQQGCPMFWRFVFMFAWSLGGLRNDHVEDEGIDRPKKKNETIMRINAAVSDFSETKAAQVAGKGVGYTFGGLVVAFLLYVVGFILFKLGVGIYLILSGGLETISLTAVIIAGVIAVLTIFYGLGKGIGFATRWIGGTEAWKLCVETAKSFHEKTCPVVKFA